MSSLASELGSGFRQRSMNFKSYGSQLYIDRRTIRQTDSERTIRSFKAQSYLAYQKHSFVIKQNIYVTMLIARQNASRQKMCRDMTKPTK